jgi:TetR/AcrR family transcriptional regulator, transcriptional repressor for nem operon
MPSSPPTPASPRTHRGRETRARIVEAAAELLSERGAAGVTLDDVKRATGASRSQLYHYFNDRDDLLRAAVGATADAVIAAQAGLLDELDGWTGIERWFDWLVELQVTRHASGGCPIGSLAGQLAEHDELARDAIADGLNRWEAALRHGLERMQARGELRDDADPAALATATMACLEGGLVLTQVRRDPQQLRTALDGAATVLRAAA